MKKQKKTAKKPRPSLEYEPVTEQELRYKSETHAQIGMAQQLFALCSTETGDTEYHERISRNSYIIAEALERWADEMKTDRLLSELHTEFESEFEGLLKELKKPWVMPDPSNEYKVPPQWYSPTVSPDTNLPQPFLY